MRAETPSTGPAAAAATAPSGVGSPITIASPEAIASSEPAAAAPATGRPGALPSAAAPIRWLAAPTSEAWLDQAIANPQTLLIDHAHCERKAAGAALQLMFRYPSDGALASALSPLAREELEHFERVHALLERRGIPLRPLAAPPYGAALAAQVRREEPARLLDSLLVAGLIEARSHERMALLTLHSPDPDLRDLYGDLLASEARHFGLYWVLCEHRWPRAQVEARLLELAEEEAALLAELHPQPRMHS